MVGEGCDSGEGNPKNAASPWGDEEQWFNVESLRKEGFFLGGSPKLRELKEEGIWEKCEKIGILGGAERGVL